MIYYFGIWIIINFLSFPMFLLIPKNLNVWNYSMHKLLYRLEDIAFHWLEQNTVNVHENRFRFSIQPTTRCVTSCKLLANTRTGENFNWSRLETKRKNFTTSRSFTATVGLAPHRWATMRTHTPHNCHDESIFRAIVEYHIRNCMLMESVEQNIMRTV